MAKLKVQGIELWGLLDSGADQSIIKSTDWPCNWPTQDSAQILRGIGYAQEPKRSAGFLTWQDDEGHSGVFQPFMLNIPMMLWGHGVMQEMGVRLVTEDLYSPQSKNMMKAMGYTPGRGLGLCKDGRQSPVPIKERQYRKGLGFS
ncbi:endogenous retrovirus group K member 7 Pro protein-like [Nannospalax galili]|uniref:endogenous retrovirus group K member 7 Pro protein-like n=1 Tax=Nannospalax galili TaxID=1026970 RepID=UPI00111C36DD|nr:endogenous retrovirus group K member 7 Pro protein-like [Nannospalax galili]